METILAFERTREKQRALIDGRNEVEIGGAEMVRLAARLIIQEALEGRRGMPWGATITLAAPCPAPGTAMPIEGSRTQRRGAIDYSAPQTADRTGPFHAPIREVVRGRTEKLEALAVEMHARGLSTCGIEAAFAGADGRSLLSRTRGERDYRGAAGWGCGCWWGMAGNEVGIDLVADCL